VYKTDIYVNEGEKMVHIMATGLYPPHVLKPLLEAFFSKNKPAYPDYLKKVYQWGAPPVEGKYRTIALYECPADKLYEAGLALARRYNFYASVKEYTFEIINLIDESDQMKIAQGK